MRPARASALGWTGSTLGLRGDWKSVGGGVCELRIDHGPGYRVYYGQDGNTLVLLLCGGAKRTQAKDIEKAYAYWKDYKNPQPLARRFARRSICEATLEIAIYIEEMLADGDARAVPVALRTVADALGGMGVLAEKTGLSRETLYRTLSEKGNPRLDTLAVILAVFGLRLSGGATHAQISCAARELRAAHT